MKPLRVGLIGYDGVQALDVIGPSDAFTIAAAEDEMGKPRPCYEVIVIGLTGKPFRAESGVVFQPQTSLRNAPSIDTLIIPGGRGARIGQSSELIARWIATRAKRIRRIASVCTGIYALARTGLLDGRKVTTHWRFADDLARRFSKLNVNHDALFLKDGPFYTSGGITASVDLALALIEEDYGPRVALSVARELVVFLQTFRRSETIFRAARIPDQLRRPLFRSGILDGGTCAKRSFTRCAGQTRLLVAAPLCEAIQASIRRNTGGVCRKSATR